MSIAGEGGETPPGLGRTLASVWALLFGIGLLMLANGLQGSLLGVRAEAEGFEPRVTGLVMAGFFAGLLAGSFWTPRGVRRVGHVRVFAAMAAVSSVSILVHAVFVEPLVWGAMRFVTGFCYAGVFVVAESWLNERAPPGGRGGVLALYMAVSFGGMGVGQLLLNLASFREADLFILVSALISLAVTPLLLSAAPLPANETGRPVSLRRLATASPLGVAGVFVAGLLNGAIFGMGAVYARAIGLSVADTSLYMALLIVGAAVLQWPIGRLSDRFDRRRVLTVVTTLAGFSALLAAETRSIDTLGAMAVIALFGGLSLSVHSLSLAYTNDYLEPSELVAASGGLVLVLGIGSVIGPVVVGIVLDAVGPSSFQRLLAACHFGLALFALWRMALRPPLPEEAQAPYVPAPLQGAELATAVAEDVLAEVQAEAGEVAEKRAPGA